MNRGMDRGVHQGVDKRVNGGINQGKKDVEDKVVYGGRDGRVNEVEEGSFGGANE